LSARDDIYIAPPIDELLFAPRPRIHFASALAAGDWNGDGFVDLAVGVPDHLAFRQRGLVFILNGSAEGITEDGASFRRFPGSGFRADGDRAGAALAAGDFNGDEFADLVIDVPGEVEPGDTCCKDAGVAWILYGSLAGFSTQQVLSQASAGILGKVEDEEGFGLALATGDLNGDGYDDLAAGVPGDSEGAGAVNVVYGSAAGLVPTGNEIWHQVKLGLSPGGGFGSAVAIGDFDDDDFADLAIGIPGQAFGEADCCPGAAFVLRGSASGLKSSTWEFLHQGRVGIPERPEPGDSFGAALTASDLNGDGFSDLVIGVPGEDDSSGAVHALYGGPAGLETEGSQIWKQDPLQLPDESEVGDRFGQAVD
jgi:FG-GAP repeat